MGPCYAGSRTISQIAFQQTVLYGSASSTASVTSGVLQGSIIDLLAFMSLSHRADLSMFADGICADCAVQVDVNAITDWTEQGELRLNVTKMKAMTVSGSAVRHL